ncbi:unnamed protein product, partial [Prorocentrum cordatum]
GPRLRPRRWHHPRRGRFSPMPDRRARVLGWGALLLSLGLVLRAGGLSLSEVFPSQGSVYGGTYLVISGSGFLYPVDANPWDAQDVYIGTIPCDIIQHYSSGTRIVCTTGAYTAYEDSAWLTVTVRQFSGLGDAGIVQMSSAFRYRTSYTPFIHYADSWAGTGGDVLRFGGYLPHMDTTGYVRISIGDTLCVTDNEVWPLQESTRRRNFKYVSCQLPQDEMAPPGIYNVSLRLNMLDHEEGECPQGACFPLTSDDNDGSTGSYGLGGIVPGAISTWVASWGFQFYGTVDLATGRSYHFTVYPQVNSIEPSVGGLHGGNTLTIHGTSFSETPADNLVSVGGIPCEVTAATASRLRCVLGDRSLWPAALRGPTPRGLVWTSFNRGGSWVPNGLTERIPPGDRTRLGGGVLKGGRIDWWGRTSFLGGAGGSNYQFEAEGFFVPPLTANYTFYVAGDDTVVLELGRNSSFDSLQRVASCPDSVTKSWYAEVNPHAWFYHGDIRTNASTTVLEVTGPDKQVSEPISLAAGERYAFRLLQTEWYGSDWYRLGMKVSGLSSALKADGTALGQEVAEEAARAQPAMELQRVKYGGTGILYETHYIQLDNASAGGIYRVAVSNSFGATEYVTFSADDSAGEVQTALRSVYLTGTETFLLSSCWPLSVSATEWYPDAFTVNRTYEVIAPCSLPQGAARHMSLSVPPSLAGLVGASAGLLVAGTPPPSGTIRVGCNGEWSDPIDPLVDPWYVVQAISQVGRDGNAVEVEAWPSMRGWTTGEAWEIFVRFRKPLGDVPLLELDLSSFVGVPDPEGPAVFSVTVVTVENGDADAVMMERVPADLFRMPHPADSEAMVVVVETLGVASATATEEAPAFSYLEGLTPVLLGVHPPTVQGGSTLTAAVANTNATDGNVTLYIGSSLACAGLTDVTEAWNGTAWWNSSDGANGAAREWRLLSCTVPNGTAGVHRVRLFSEEQGLADPSLAPNVTYLPAVEDISPLTGSMAGGTLFTVSGDGLAKMPCAEITIGGLACSEAAVSPFGTAPLGGDSVVCLTPDALNGASLEDVLEEVEAEIVLLMPTPQVIGTFVYSVNNTPVISAVSPEQHSAALTVEVVLSGQRLGGDSAPPVVAFGGRPCVVEQHTARRVECWLQRSVPAPPANSTMQPTVWVEGLGRAAVNSSAAFTTLFEVASLSPSYASIAGGAIVTLTGSGFHPSDPWKHEVFLDLPDGTEHPCVVLSGSDSELRCKLETAAAPDGYSFSVHRSGTILGRRLAAAEAGAGGAHGRKIDCARERSPKTKGHCLAKSVMSMGRVRSMGAEHPMAKGLAKLAAVPPAHAFSGPWAGRSATAADLDGHGRPGTGRRLSAATGTASATMSSITPTSSTTLTSTSLTSSATDPSTTDTQTSTTTLTSSTQTSTTPTGPSVASATPDDSSSETRTSTVTLTSNTENVFPSSVPPSTDDISSTFSTTTLVSITQTSTTLTLDSMTSDTQTSTTTPTSSTQTSTTPTGPSVTSAPTDDSSSETRTSTVTLTSNTENVFPSSVPPSTDDISSTFSTTTLVSTTQTSTTLTLDSMTSDTQTSTTTPTSSTQTSTTPTGPSVTSAPTDDSSSETRTSTVTLTSTTQSSTSDSSTVTATATTAATTTVFADTVAAIRLTLNGVTARCVAAEGCGVVYSQIATPKLLDVWPLNGTVGTKVEVTLEGQQDGNRMKVFFGDVQCNVSSWRIESGDYELVQADVFGLGGLNLTQTVLEVPLCEFPAGDVPVLVAADPQGYALNGSPHLGADLWFSRPLELYGLSPENGSSHGGLELTISGAGFSSVPGENFVTVGDRVCQVSAASFGELRCWAPRAPGGAEGAQELRVVVGSAGTGAGLSADFYHFGALVSIDDFGSYSPDSNGTTPTLSFESDVGTALGLGFTTGFGVDWRGYLTIATPGTYVFSLVSDDGSGLWIDDALIVDNSGWHGAAEVMGTAAYLEEGDHYIEIKYTQGYGSSNIVFSYAGPDTGEVTVVVPETALKPLQRDAGPQLQFEYVNAVSPQVLAIAVVSAAAEAEVELLVNGSGFGSTPGAVVLGVHRDPTA